MADEKYSDETTFLLQRKPAEQDEIAKRFETASPADSYKEEIDLEEKYRLVTEFRMNPNQFLVKHTPTEILAE